MKLSQDAVSGITAMFEGGGEPAPEPVATPEPVAEETPIQAETSSEPTQDVNAKVEDGADSAPQEAAAEDSPAAQREDSTVDAVTVEVERWERLSEEIYSEFVAEDDDLTE